MWLGTQLGKRQHGNRMRRCAGLSAVIIQCHPDTWRFALMVMSRPWVADTNRWQKDPADSVTAAPDGLVHVRLSGAKLAELMFVLWYLPNRRRGTYSAPDGMRGFFTGGRATPAEEEQAARFYDAIAPAVDRVEVNTPRKGDFPVVIIDDAMATR